jgi:hypothetical protein
VWRSLYCALDELLQAWNDGGGGQPIVPLPDSPASTMGTEAPLHTPTRRGGGGGPVLVNNVIKAKKKALINISKQPIGAESHARWVNWQGELVLDDSSYTCCSTHISQGAQNLLTSAKPQYGPALFDKGVVQVDSWDLVLGHDCSSLVVKVHHRALHWCAAGFVVGTSRVHCQCTFTRHIACSGVRQRLLCQSSVCSAHSPRGRVNPRVRHAIASHEWQEKKSQPPRAACYCIKRMAREEEPTHESSDSSMLLHQTNGTEY